MRSKWWNLIPPLMWCLNQVPSCLFWHVLSIIRLLIFNLYLNFSTYLYMYLGFRISKVKTGTLIVSLVTDKRSDKSWQTYFKISGMNQTEIIIKYPGLQNLEYRKKYATHSKDRSVYAAPFLIPCMRNVLNQTFPNQKVLSLDLQLIFSFARSNNL